MVKVGSYLRSFELFVNNLQNLEGALGRHGGHGRQGTQGRGDRGWGRSGIISPKICYFTKDGFPSMDPLVGAILYSLFKSKTEASKRDTPDAPNDLLDV